MTHQAVGYARVSSTDQNPDRQLQGIELNRKFIDYISGSSKDRPELISCIEYIRSGDTLYIDSIDRLARNLRDLQEIINTIINKGVVVKFVKESLTFCIEQDPIANLTLHLMGAFAEFERTMIKSRQREGIDAAKKAGKHLGRPTLINKKMISEAKDLRGSGMSIRQISFKMNVSRVTIYKILAMG